MSEAVLGRESTALFEHQATVAVALNGPTVVVNGAEELFLGRSEHERVVEAAPGNVTALLSVERLEFREGSDSVDGKVGMPWRPPFSDLKGASSSPSTRSLTGPSAAISFPYEATWPPAAKQRWMAVARAMRLKAFSSSSLMRTHPSPENCARESRHRWRLRYRLGKEHSVRGPDRLGNARPGAAAPRREHMPMGRTVGAEPGAEGGSLTSATRRAVARWA